MRKLLTFNLKEKRIVRPKIISVNMTLMAVKTLLRLKSLVFLLISVVVTISLLMP